MSVWVYDFGVDFGGCLQKSEAASMETSRASVVAMNAEIRRAKARMMEEVPKLHKLALKKVKKEKNEFKVLGGVW